MVCAQSFSVLSDFVTLWTKWSFRPYGILATLWKPARLFCPWDSPGKNTGVSCHALLQASSQPGDLPNPVIKYTFFMSPALAGTFFSTSTTGKPIKSDQIRSVAQSCPTLCDPMNHSMPGLPVHHQLPEFTQTHVHESVMPSSHLTLCRPLLFLPPIPPSIRVFSSESTLRMRWPKYWSFSFSIIPSKENPGLIFRMDWLDLVAV